ncbi:MAG: hypothetical protein C0410_12075 [Anaerolinea sp.]|nr:hypothetical protein [Anaerolinea sp.]
MSIEIEAVFGRNITLVFDALDINSIDRNRLREIVPGKTPTLMDMPEMMVAVYPPEPFIIQIGDRRIRLNLSAEIPVLGDFPLWQYAEQCNDLVNPDRAKLIAFGYNFDFGIQVSDRTINDLMISKFVQNRHELEEIVNGELVNFLPRITYKNEKVQYDIVFEPFELNRIKVHGNSHFQEEGLRLPKGDLLRESYLENFESIRGVVLNLLAY